MFFNILIKSTMYYLFENSPIIYNFSYMVYSRVLSVTVPINFMTSLDDT